MNVYNSRRVITNRKTSKTSICNEKSVIEEKLKKSVIEEKLKKKCLQSKTIIKYNIYKK